MDLTVVIPSFQRREHLVALLDSIDAAVGDDLQDRVEVVVSLDGSTDGSEELVERRAADATYALRVVWHTNSGAAGARNRGVAAASGDLVWFVDDDLRVSARALRAHLDHDRSAAPVAMGACEIHSDEPTAAIAGEWYDERWSRLAHDVRITDPIDLTYANASMPTRLAEAYPFDERFHGYGSEDTELSIRLLDAGTVAEYLPSAAVEHAFSPSVDERLQKLRQEGHNRVLLSELHPTVKVSSDRPGRFERSLITASRWPGSVGPLWGVARSLSLAARAPGMQRLRGRVQQLAETAALYSGVAQAGRAAA